MRPSGASPLRSFLRRRRSTGPMELAESAPDATLNTHHHDRSLLLQVRQYTSNREQRDCQSAMSVRSRIYCTSGRRARSAAVVLLAVAVAGCGSSSQPITNARFVARVNQLCRELKHARGDPYELGASEAETTNHVQTKHTRMPESPAERELVNFIHSNRSLAVVHAIVAAIARQSNLETSSQGIIDAVFEHDSTSTQRRAALKRAEALYPRTLSVYLALHKLIGDCAGPPPRFPVSKELQHAYGLPERG